jgi:hypothetical protein
MPTLKTRNPLTGAERTSARREEENLSKEIPVRDFP